MVSFEERAPLRIALVATLLTAVAAPVGITQAHAQEQRMTRDMRDIARRMQDPPDTETRPSNQCPDQSFLVRCLHSDRDADAVAQDYRRALSEAAGQPADFRCNTLPSQVQARMCFVRLLQGDHGVVVIADTDVVRTDGKPRAAGSRVKIDAL